MPFSRTKEPATQPAAELQTLTTPTAEGDIQVTSDKLLMWDSLRSAVVDVGSERLLRRAVVSLTSADILVLNATPITIVAAPGALKGVIVHGIVFEMTRTATAYANGGTVVVEYEDGQDIIATIAATVVTGAAGTTYTYRGTADLSNFASASLTNKAVQISNATAAFDTGTGTAKVYVWYSVIPTI